MKFKKVISAFLSVLVLTGTLSTALAEEAKKITVIVDDRFVVFKDQDPIISPNNDTLIPVRGVLEAMDATVEWNGDDRSVTVKSQDKEKELVLWIDNPVMKKYIIDGDNKTESEVTMSTPPMIINDKTLVPLRVISENLDAKVGWNGEIRQITITSKEYEAFKNEKLVKQEGDEKIPELKDIMPYFSIEADEATIGAGSDFCIDINISNTDLLDDTYLTDGATATLFYDNTKVKPVSSIAVFNELSTSGQVYGSEFIDTKNSSIKYNFIVAADHRLNLEPSDGTIVRVEFVFINDATEAEISLANTIQSDGKYGMSLTLKNQEDKSKLILNQSEQIYIDTTPVRVVK